MTIASLVGDGRGGVPDDDGGCGVWIVPWSLMMETVMGA